MKIIILHTMLNYSLILGIFCAHVFTKEPSTSRSISEEGTYFSISTNATRRSSTGDDEALDAWESGARPALKIIRDSLEVYINKMVHDSLVKLPFIKYDKLLPSAGQLKYGEKRDGKCNDDTGCFTSYMEMNNFFKNKNAAAGKNSQNPIATSGISYISVQFSFSRIPDEGVVDGALYQYLSKILPCSKE